MTARQRAKLIALRTARLTFIVFGGAVGYHVGVLLWLGGAYLYAPSLFEDGRAALTSNESWTAASSLFVLAFIGLCAGLYRAAIVGRPKATEEDSVGPVVALLNSAAVREAAATTTTEEKV